MLDRWTRFLAVCAALSCGLVLAGCSGGGGGNGLSGPVITSQPANATVPSGQTATFSVTAAGTPSPSYQWRRNGVNIDGATAASYVTPAVALPDGGATYSVVVSNSQGAVTSGNALLAVHAVTTSEKRSLVDLALLNMELYAAALAPFDLADGDTFLEPTTVCQSGVGAAVFNGVPTIPGQVMPGSGTLGATFTQCMLADGTGYTGTSSLTFDVPDPEVWHGVLNFTASNMRRTTRDSGVVDRDYTIHGAGELVATTVQTASDVSLTFSANPGAGATLRNEVSGLTAVFNSGGMDFTLGADTAGNGRFRLAWNAVNTTIAGVDYVTDGFYEITFDANGQLTGATGSVDFTADGTLIGRVYTTGSGVGVEVDGVAEGLKVPTRSHRR